jgi:TPR repeat protein
MGTQHAPHQVPPGAKLTVRMKPALVDSASSRQAIQRILEGEDMPKICRLDTLAAARFAAGPLLIALLLALSHASWAAPNDRVAVDPRLIADYQLSAERGDALAMLRLGHLYENGQAVAQDAAIAAQWYRKAAIQGEAHAQFALGRLYQAGTGVAQDPSEAARWYRQAAAQGSNDARMRLSGLFLAGTGVPQDDREAAALIKQVADDGEARGQAALGVLLREGRGLPRDEEAGLALLRRAAEQDYKPAKEILARDAKQSPTPAPATTAEATETYAPKLELQNTCRARTTTAKEYLACMSTPEARQILQAAAMAKPAKAQTRPAGESDAVADYLPRPSTRIEQQCAAIALVAANEYKDRRPGDGRALSALTERWATPGQWDSYFERNPVLMGWARQFAPSCAKRGLFLLQAWMDTLGQANGMPYADAKYRALSDAALKRAREELAAAKTERTRAAHAEQEALKAKARQAAVERGALHVFGLALGERPDNYLMECTISAAQTCLARSRLSNVDSEIQFSKSELPDYLSDLAPDYRVPASYQGGYCAGGFCTPGFTTPEQRGYARTVGLNLIDGRTERIRFNIDASERAKRLVSDSISQKFAAKPVAKDSKTGNEWTWTRNGVKASLECQRGADHCWIDIWTDVLAKTLNEAERKRQAEARPL